MTPLQIATLSIRLVALVGVLYTVSNLYGLFAYLNEGSGVAISKTVVWFFAIFKIGICALLWLFPATIATKLLPSLRSSEAGSSAPFVQWQTVGVICIGLWGLTRAIPDAVYWVTFYNMTVSTGLGFSTFNAEQKAGMITTAVELAIGFWLLFGAKGFAAFLFKARTAGLSK